MEQPKSSDKGIGYGSAGYLELASKITKRQVVTLVISGDRLPLYLDAASATGFKVEKIADEGEEFPRKLEEHEIRSMQQSKDGKHYIGDSQPKVSNTKVQGKGYIAVSIERPESSKSHVPFWEKVKILENLEQEEA